MCSQICTIQVQYLITNVCSLLLPLPPSIHTHITALTFKNSGQKVKSYFHHPLTIQLSSGPLHSFLTTPSRYIHPWSVLPHTPPHHPPHHPPPTLHPPHLPTPVYNLRLETEDSFLHNHINWKWNFGTILSTRCAGHPQGEGTGLSSLSFGGKFWIIPSHIQNESSVSSTCRMITEKKKVSTHNPVKYFDSVLPLLLEWCTWCFIVVLESGDVCFVVCLFLLTAKWPGLLVAMESEEGTVDMRSRWIHQHTTTIRWL